MSVDFNALRAAIRDGAGKAFTQVRQAHPDEEFYAFALYTDDGAMTVEPAANSEEALQRKVGGDGEAGSARSNYDRWATAEWSYEAEGGEHLQDVYDLLNAPNRYGDEEVAASDEEDDSPEDFEEEERFPAFKTQLIEAMTGALHDLDAAGFFGGADEREKVTLFVSISDSDEADQTEDESALSLNPDAVCWRFLARHP